MKILENESLKLKTTFHVGGIAEKFYIPESTEELMSLIRDHDLKDYRIISGGSNLLINDEKKFNNVISMEKVDVSLNYLGGGEFYIGASNRIQKVISFVNSLGYGGFEEYIGLPALFGGIVYMNAGIGSRSSQKFCIADFIVRVKAIEKKTANIIWIEVNDCEFSYRHSVFQKDGFIILGAEIKLSPQSKDVSLERIKKRQEYIKNNQEFGKGCFGTCFSKCRDRILKIVSLLPHRLWGGQVYQSAQNSNWLVNKGDCTYKQAMLLINFCVLLHKLTFSKIELEVCLWK